MVTARFEKAFRANLDGVGPVKGDNYFWLMELYDSRTEGKTREANILAFGYIAREFDMDPELKVAYQELIDMHIAGDSLRYAANAVTLAMSSMRREKPQFYDTRLARDLRREC